MPTVVFVWTIFLFTFVILRVLWHQPPLTPEEKQLHSQSRWFLLTVYGWVLGLTLSILAFTQLSGVHATVLLSALFLGLWAWAMRQAVADGVWVTAGALCCLLAAFSFVLVVLYGPELVIVPFSLIITAIGFMIKHVFAQFKRGKIRPAR
jgi:hypothetical protein